MPLQALTAECMDGECSHCLCRAFVICVTNGLAKTQWLCRECMANGQAFLLETAVRKPINRQMKQASERQEKKIARDIGGHRQKASGAMAHAKGDVRKHGSLRVEAKYTKAQSYTVKYDDLAKIRSECVGNETPAFQITFMNRDLQPLDEWVLIPYAVWRKLHAASENR